MNTLKVLIAVLFVSGAAYAAEPVQTPAISDFASYPLTVCVVSGEALDAGAVSVMHEGREITFCCKSCVGDFKKEPAAFVEKLDAMIIETQLPIYPLDTCPVSGEALGSMGDPINQVTGNRLVRLCCSGCKTKLAANPAAFIAKLDQAAIAAQAESYTATVCPISGAALGSMGDAYDYVHAGRLVRFCCAGCIDKFEADPAAAFATLASTNTDETTDAASEGKSPETGAKSAHDVHESHDHRH
ncbi:MAG: hypothetical protein HKN20_00625 [Gemmatimonadetes bacterium]|nr:hypothetical protein [Gemmatimonadota bacterium]